MLKGFKNFIMQGNVIDLAVAVVIGTAFAAVINALVESVLMPLISALVGAPDFDSFAVVNIDGNLIQFGVLLTQVVNFLLIAAAIYFVVVVPMNKMIEARNRNGAPEVAEDENITLLKEIRDQLTAQTERVNPEAFAAAVAAESEVAEAARMAAEAQEQKDSTLRGRAKNFLWGKD